MLTAFRIVIAVTMLFGSSILGEPAQAGGLSRNLPRAEQPAKTDPCKGTWPYLVRTCLA